VEGKERKGKGRRVKERREGREGQTPHEQKFWLQSSVMVFGLKLANCEFFSAHQNVYTPCLKKTVKIVFVRTSSNFHQL